MILTHTQASNYRMAHVAAACSGATVHFKIGDEATECVSVYPYRGLLRVGRIERCSLVEREDYASLDEFAAAYRL